VPVAVRSFELQGVLQLRISCSLSQHLSDRLRLLLSITLLVDGCGVHPKAHVVEEHSTADEAIVDQELVPLTERFQSSKRIIAVQTQIQRKMVAGTDRDAEERHISLICNRGNQTQRPVATGHPDRICAGVDRIVRELSEIVTSL
jgi:hypothetical protein